MPTSTIDRVKAAELAAMESQSKAESDAAKIAEGAGTKADAIIKAARDEAAAASQAKILEAQQNAEQIVKAAKDSAAKQAQALYDTTRKKQDIVNRLFLDSLV